MITASRVAVNTTLSAATGGLTVLFLSLFLGRPGDIGPMLNGIITALVAITSPCALVYPYAAVIIGLVRATCECIPGLDRRSHRVISSSQVAGMVYLGGAWLLRVLKIDDPMETTAVHLGGGIWGMIAVGFFATERYTIGIQAKTWTHRFATCKVHH